jgi:hypothetical protein
VIPLLFLYLVEILDYYIESSFVLELSKKAVGNVPKLF